MDNPLDDTGARVTHIAPVVVAPAALDRPTHGTVVDGRLYFLATAAGEGDSNAPRPVRIVETGIQGLQNIMPPDMQRFLEQQARQRMAPPEDMQPSSAGSEEKDPEG